MPLAQWAGLRSLRVNSISKPVPQGRLNLSKDASPGDRPHNSRPTGELEEKLDSDPDQIGSIQSANYLPDKLVSPLIWTALKFNRPFGTGFELIVARRVFSLEIERPE